MGVRVLEHAPPTQETYHVGNIWWQCLAPLPVFPDHSVGMEVGSSQWLVIQLAINTQKIMQILTYRPKLWWYAPVASLDSTICDACKTCKDFEFFQWRPFWKMLMPAITRTRWYILTFVFICYIAGHQYTIFHANIHM